MHHQFTVLNVTSGELLISPWSGKRAPAETQAHLLDVLVLIDAGCESRGEALVDIRLVSELFERGDALLREKLLLVLLVQPVQTPLVCLAEMDGVDVGLVHRLHLALSRVYAHGCGSVDTFFRGGG